MGNDADAAIGIGLKGRSTAKEMGARWTEYFNSNAPNKKAYKKVWLSVAGLEWTPIMKIISMGTTFGFSSKYWTDDRTLNPTSSLSELKDAKYPAFNTQSFNSIRMCIDDYRATKCVYHTFTRIYNSARDLFASGYIRDPKVDQKGIEKTFGAKGHKACGMQRPGFNIQCKDNNKARWGFCNNIPNQGCQTSDSNDADAAIGIGLKGQSTAKEMGAGWTEYFNSNSPNKKKYKKVWLFVENLNINWAPVMKIISTGTTFGFSSKYWTDTRTLNPTSSLSQAKDAKYPAFMNKPFTMIRMCVGVPNKNCVIHTFKKAYKSARELFSAGYIRDTQVDQKGIELAFDSTTHRACGMQRPGFNIQCKDNNKARWGFCNNIPSQGCQTSDG